MPRSLFEIEGLINGTIQIEHEMNTQITVIVQDIEALAADPAYVEVNDELVHDLLQGWQVPAPAPHSLNFLIGEARLTHIVAVRRGEVLRLLVRILPVGFFERCGAGAGTCQPC